MKKSLNQKGHAGRQTGFTLIELLVVVAIIGILAATILASLGSARSRARISRAQSEMSSMRAQAELVYSTTGSYAGAAADPAMIRLVTSVNEIATDTTPSQIILGANAQSWAFSATLGGSVFCVDSNGFAGPSNGVTNGACTAPSVPQQPIQQIQ